MSSKIKLMPPSHKYDEMYLTINGNFQGLISKGASSAESLGSHYKHGHGHEDAISVKSFSYGGSNPVHQGSGRVIGQGHSDAFGIIKMVDKSSPLLHNAMNGEGLSSVELKCYRTSFAGQPEYYYTIRLKHAKVVVVDTLMPLESNELIEYVYFSYHQVSIVHERCGTISKSNWNNSYGLQSQRMNLSYNSNDFNGYNALISSLRRRDTWIKEHPQASALQHQRLVTFWTIVTLPLGGVALYRGSYGAFMWAYRNPFKTLYGIEVVNDVFNESMPPITPHGVIINTTLKAF